MSKAKKITVAVISVIIVAVIFFLAVFPHMRETAYGKMSSENPPEIVADFEEKADGAIRIMSFNVRCAYLGIVQRADREYYVAETIRKSNADSFGVQEATPAWMKYLSEELKDKYSYVGVGRNNGRNSGEYSAIFFLKDKYTALDSGTFWLSETPETPSVGWDAKHKRICTWAVLENKETGEKYVHLNAHFDHKGEEAQQNSVDMILQKVSDYGNIPVVFTADMNVREGSECYERIVSDGVLKDTKYLAEDTMDYLTFHDTVPSENEGRVLDYVMVNDRFNAEAYRVVTAGIDGRFVSDHYPIYADVVIK